MTTLKGRPKVVKTTGVIDSEGRENDNSENNITHIYLFDNDPSRVFPCTPPFSMRRGSTPRLIIVFPHVIRTITVIHLLCTIGTDQHRCDVTRHYVTHWRGPVPHDR
jgi:hypothetical protein